jgi:hypothetical protein
MSGSVAQKLFVSSSPSSGRSALPMIMGAIAFAVVPEPVEGAGHGHGDRPSTGVSPSPPPCPTAGH